MQFPFGIYPLSVLLQSKARMAMHLFSFSSSLLLQSKDMKRFSSYPQTKVYLLLRAMDKMHENAKLGIF
jgi:hypothetical protein